MIDTELRLEAVFGLAFGTGHDSCVGDEYVKGL